MAVHTFSVNLDSLSGNMAHNYYLYENDGKLNVIPWDYNLSFGGMGMGAGDGASGMINDAIDTPFQGTDFFDALLEEIVNSSAHIEHAHGLNVDGGGVDQPGGILPLPLIRGRDGAVLYRAPVRVRGARI